jgi:hypothetical protein
LAITLSMRSISINRVAGSSPTAANRNVPLSLVPARRGAGVVAFATVVSSGGD